MSAPPDSQPSSETGPRTVLLADTVWGVVIALVIALLLILSASPDRADRGFIYVDF
ncbi:MAG: hypothetical protein JNJ46_32595 [Myxococcales bacterium]|nr:hypothetical protein [Myxococcales bacterium]